MSDLRRKITTAMHEHYCGSPPSCGNKPHAPCRESQINPDEVTAIIKAVLELEDAPPCPLPEPELGTGGAAIEGGSDAGVTEWPRIVCLCGSTRYPEAWKTAHREESLAGRIVLSVGVMIQVGDSPIRHDGPEKRTLDELHLRKIDLADEVLVLNVDGYIGESTAREVAYAQAHGKPVRYLEPTP